MNKIGYIDDKKDCYDSYKKIFSRIDIELVYCENCSTMDDVLKWILSENISTLIIDFKLNLKYNFTGNDLLNFCSSKLSDLPCIILTNYSTDAIEQQNVPSFLVLNRDDLLGNERNEICEKIKECTNVFENRLKGRILEYKSLKLKKENNSIEPLEEERFIELFKILRSYDEIDDIPSILLNNTIESKIDSLINGINDLLKK